MTSGLPHIFLFFVFFGWGDFGVYSYSGATLANAQETISGIGDLNWESVTY